MDLNNYSDIVYSLYNLGSSGVDFQDFRYRQLLSALNGIRSRRGENTGEWTNLTGTGQNPFNAHQYSTLLNQIDAYMNYLTKSKKIPQSLLEKCDPSSRNTIHLTNGVEEYDGKTDEYEELEDLMELDCDNEGDEVLQISDLFHRRNEFWGPGNFWIDYKDNLEQNKLSFFLSAITNVKTMTQYIIHNGSNNNPQIIIKFEQLFRDIGLTEYLTSFLNQNNTLTTNNQQGSVNQPNSVDKGMSPSVENSADMVEDDKKSESSSINSNSNANSNSTGASLSDPRVPSGRDLMYKYNYSKLLVEIIKLEKKINLLLLQKNVKSILNVTKLVQPFRREEPERRSRRGAASHNNTAENMILYKKYLLEYIKNTNLMQKERQKLKRKFTTLTNKYYYKHYSTTPVTGAATPVRSGSTTLPQTAVNSNISSPAAESPGVSEPQTPARTSTAPTAAIEVDEEFLIKENVYANIPTVLVGKLRNYQLYGMSWLVSLYNNKFNGILADEMGLGKTIQTIALFIYLKENKGISGSHIIIAPLSTLHSNWKTEFELWYPSFKLCIYEGSKEWRKNLRMKWYNGNKLNFDILLTSETFVLRDKNFLKKICWEYLVIDEAHKFKNENSRLVRILNNMFISKRRLLLTGTLPQNNINELKLLLNFVKPQLFNNTTNVMDAVTTKQIEQLDVDGSGIDNEQKFMIVKNNLKRRMKKDVLNELPSSFEYIVSCPMSGIQTRLYEFFLLKDAQNKFLQLRRICNHPYLYINNSNDLIINSCGKMCILDLILSRLYYVNHRVLIFSQMTSVLDLLEIYLNYRNYKYLRLDGNLNSEKRMERIRLFNEPDSKYFVFILSSKAGSLGINLQSADTVVIYDSDWNPQNDLQAQSRVHRIGQKNEVITLRLITPNTIEDSIYKCKYNMNNNNEDSNDENNIIDNIKMLNNILKRSDNDLDVFNIVGYRNFILNPFSLIKQRVIPPFLYKSLIVNKKLHLSEDDKRKLYIDNNIWTNIYNEYNIYSTSLSTQCLNSFQNLIAESSQTNLGSIRHIITQLNINYPTEHLAEIDSIPQFTCVNSENGADQKLNTDMDKVENFHLNKEILKFITLHNASNDSVKGSKTANGLKRKGEDLGSKKLGIINRAIHNTVEKVIEEKKFIEFNELPNKTYLSDYYERIQFPICLHDILDKSKDNLFYSLFQLREMMDQICSNAKAYNGQDSVIFAKSLNLYNVIVSSVTSTVAAEFIAIHDTQAAKNLTLILQKLQL